MDSLTLLIIASLVLGLVFNAMRFMRFIGFVTGAGRRSHSGGRSFDDLQSFDDRLAERLRQMERGNRL
jgi:hypothetical protein